MPYPNISFAMSYEVLFRKWRPQTFEEVVGQPFVVKTLRNALRAGRVAHAYLFSGSRGVGKTTVARILAKALNCTQGEPDRPCNQCKSCREITANLSPDVHEIDGASNRGIDEIRNLKEHVRYLPTSGRFRVFIIDEVHMLTIHAFNALLKTLEEPPKHVKFIFATTEVQKVPITILSRCQRFDFRRIPTQEILNHLSFICEREGITIEEKALALIARKAEGSLRDAQGLLDQVVSFTGKDVRERDVEEILGGVGREVVLRAIKATASKDPGQALMAVHEAYERGYDLKEMYYELMAGLKNALLIGLGVNPETLETSQTEEEALREVFMMLGPSTLNNLLGIMLHYEELVRTSECPKIVLEAVLARLSMVGELVSLKELASKVMGGEVPKISMAQGDQKAHQSSGDKEVQQAFVADTKGDKKGWDDFLLFLEKRNRLMAKSLREWGFEGLEGERLILRKPDHPVLSQYLEDNERCTQLKKVLKEFFGRDLAIITKEGGEVQVPPSPVEELKKRFKAEIIPNGAIFNKTRRSMDERTGQYGPVDETGTATPGQDS